MPAFRLDTRILTGGVVALALLLAFDLFASLADADWSVDVRTPFGPFSVVTLAVTFVAMAVGGWVARRGFTWVALALTALTWVTVVVTLLAIAGPDSPAQMRSVGGVLRYNAAAIVLGLATAWLGAWVGQRLAQRRATVSEHA